MSPSPAKIAELPRVLKAAFFLLALHVLVYCGYIAWTAVAGAEVHLVWFLHVGVVLYLLREVRRPAKGLAYTLAGYCFIMPFVMLRADYVRAVAAGDLGEMLLRSLPMMAPLLLAGVCVIVGRGFYVRVRNAA